MLSEVRLSEKSMRSALAISLTIFLTLIVARLHLASADTGLNIPVTTGQGVTATIALSIEDSLGQFTVQQSVGTAVYSDGNYEVQVSETPSKNRSIIHVVARKISGDAFRVDSFSATVRVPRASIAGIWYPGADPSSTSAMVTDATRSINDISDANYGIPYIAAAGANSKNVFAMGLGRQDLAVSITGQPLDPDFYEFRLKALTGRTSSTFDERFYVSTDGAMNWFNAAANYADWVDRLNKYEPFPVSDTAYEPLYDAWYWAGDRVDDQLYRDTAKIASQVGMGLYLADSGWDTEAGEYVKWLNGSTGNYSPPPDKFQNLEQTFNDIRAQDNLGIDLWLQPFAVGRQSTRYDSTRNMHVQLPPTLNANLGWSGVSYAPFTLPLGNNLEDVNICPRMAPTETYLKNLFTDVATKYNAEGYWLDFIDGMPTYCTALHHHSYTQFGEGFRHSLQTIKDTILTYNPRAIVHFRARYANLNTKPYASVWQSGDSPDDFDRMRLNTIRLRPFSKGVVFAADEMFWPEGISDTQVSKFIMTSVMVGVPAFGPTLLYSPPSTLQMMKAWLDFYRENKLDIATGKFSLFGQLQMPNHKIDGHDRTYAYIRNLDFPQVVAEGSTVFLMNATDSNEIRAKVRVPAGTNRYFATVLDKFLVPEPGEMLLDVNSRNVLLVDTAVEQGGMVILTPAPSVTGPVRGNPENLN
jgi:hypothetical protein